MPVIPPGGEFDNMAVRGTKEYKQLNDVLDHQPLTGCIAATARLRYWNTDVSFPLNILNSYLNKRFLNYAIL